MNKTPSPKHEANSTPPAKGNGGKHEPAKHDAAKMEPVKHDAVKHDARKVVDDSEHGKGLMAKVNARKAELEHALKVAQSVQASETEGNRAKEIEKALGAVATLLTGDLKNIDEANGTVLNEWMETSAVLVNIRPAAKAQPAPAPVPHSAH